MKLGVYNIINDPLPKLNKIRDINVEIKEFEYEHDIVGFMNRELKMDKLSSEHIYALSLTFDMKPRGIIQVAVGKCDECEIDMRELATGLLLTGAEQFMCFHNHPGGAREIPDTDKRVSGHYERLGDLIGVEFDRHIMITQGYYAVCEPIYTLGLFDINNI